MQLSTHRFKWRRIVWLILVDKRFRWQFAEVVAYALLNANEKRGQYASGVLIFEGNGYTDEITEPIPF
jgi:hypothetical protein